MKVIELGHVAFKCQNLNKSVKFYCDMLGFEIKTEIKYGDLADGMRKKAHDKGYKVDTDKIEKLEKRREKTWFIFLEIAKRQFLELFEKGDASEICVPDDDRLNYQHMALIVDNIALAEKELTEKGVQIDHGIGYNVDGNYSMWIHDPDGNKIEIIQYTENALQFK